jgi:hypothetical protein
MDAHSGNKLKTAELVVELAQNTKDMNEHLGESTMFMDAMRMRIAETNLELQKFGETMANTTFDAVRDSFKDLIKNMSDGTKSLGDIAMEFFGSIVSRIHDKLLDRAANQITTGIMEAFGFNGGGMVSRYSSGGTTRQVPAMLTSGEYVVRKRLVDKLGVGALSKMNNAGSLEDLYNENSGDSFELMNEGGMAASHGARQSYMSSGPMGAIARAFGGLVKLFGGGFLKSDASDSAGMKISKGGGYLAGSAISAYQNRSGSGAEAPTAPKFSRLNTSSALNIDPRSNRMSSRFRANDQYSQDYKKYQLDKYDFDVNQRNAKLQNRASTIQGVVNSIGFMGISTMANAYGNKVAHNKQAKIDAQNTAVANRIGSLVPDERGGSGGELASRSELLASLGLSSTTNNSSIKGGVTNNNTVNRGVSSINSILDGDRNINRYSHNTLASSWSSPTVQNTLIPDERSGRPGRYSTQHFQTNISSLIPSERSGEVVRSHGFQSGGEAMSKGGMVRGSAGIDKVGPIMLDRGEYVIKASSVNKIEKQYPGFFEQLNSAKMKDGGVVDPSSSQVSNTTETVNNTDSSSSNVTVNINVSSGGGSSVDGGGAGDQALASKIKEAVVGVISQEKRVGGMLRGY